MKFQKMVAGALVAGTLTLGTAGLASAQPVDNGGAKDRICSHVQEGLPKLNELKQRLATLEKKLQDARAKAEAAGKTQLVNRIDNLLGRVHQAQHRVDTAIERLTKLCAPAPVG